MNKVGAPAFRGQEVKEALRAQMEVQRRLFEQVEVPIPSCFCSQCPSIYSVLLWHIGLCAIIDSTQVHVSTLLFDQ